MKGAIEVSVGFLIIMVVSALVLIFIMGWLGGLFPQLQQITRYATAQAEQEMMNKFAEGGDIMLATLPYKEVFQPGSQVHFKIGVKKNTAVKDNDYFAFCVGKMDQTSCTSPAGENPVAVTGDTSKIQFKFPQVTKITETGDIGMMSAVMVIPRETKTGIYGFRMYTCSGTSVSVTCAGLANSYAQFDFIVEVK